MAFSHGSIADVYANGWVLSGFLNSASFAGSRDTAETTTFKKTAKTYIGGIADTTASFEGLYDGADDAVDEILDAATTATSEQIWTYYPEGDVLAKFAKSMPAFESSYEVTSDVGDASQISAEAQGSDMQIRGQVVRILSAGAGPGQTAAVDSGIVTNSMVIADVQATTATALNVKLQDSADGSVWADLAGTTQVLSARGAVRLKYATTPAPRRHARVNFPSGSGTFAVVLAIKP